MSTIVGTRIGSLVGTRENTCPAANYPASAAATAALTGITPSALYLCNETSGNLADSVGAATLVAAGAPLYQYQVDDRNGIYYAAAGDGHRADVNDLGLASGLYACVFRTPQNPTVTTFGVIGRGNAGVTECIYVYTTGGINYLQALIRDDGAGSVQLGGVPDDVKNVPWAHLVTLQIDRANTTARMRISRPGRVVSESSVSIAGFTTLTGVGQQFGFGAIPGMVGGGSMVSWAMVATGAQCEGAGVPTAIARGLGFES